eukprot:scaffold10560_cov133-Isochrysis_galbana.AAC.18
MAKWNVQLAKGSPTSSASTSDCGATSLQRRGSDAARTAVNPMDAPATTTPTTATESSRSTAGLSGSLPRERYWRGVSLSLLASLCISDQATDSVNDSRTPAATCSRERWLDE